MRSNIFLTSSLIVILITSGLLNADDEGPPRPYITTSPHGRYYFKMLPKTLESPKPFEYLDGEPKTIPHTGISYELKADGNDVELWRIEGWYASEVYLAGDGEHLVRMGSWPRGQEPSEDHLAVACYRGGGLFKEYSTADLIKRKRKVKRSLSHYFWRAEDQSYPRIGPNYFKLKTIENTVYTFDIFTGEIISSKRKF